MWHSICYRMLPAAGWRAFRTGNLDLGWVIQALSLLYIIYYIAPSGICSHLKWGNNTTQVHIYLSISFRLIIYSGTCRVSDNYFDPKIQQHIIQLGKRVELYNEVTWWYSWDFSLNIWLQAHVNLIIHNSTLKKMIFCDNNFACLKIGQKWLTTDTTVGLLRRISYLQNDKTLRQMTLSFTFYLKIIYRRLTRLVKV